jgi:putative tryptophan/tyrosine transport system substrate-binding protein
MMGAAIDPVGLGFVASLAHPGGNITGLSFPPGELTGKRPELLKETVPQSARIAVLVNPTNPSHASMVSQLTLASQGLGVQLHVLELRGPEA